MEDEYSIPGYGTVKKTLRRWWVNCAKEPDDEILAIDKLEDCISPLDESTIHIRQLIGCLECCHHKLERHVDIIIEAVRTGSTVKAKGKRFSNTLSSREQDYRALLQILSSWPSDSTLKCEYYLGQSSGRELLDLLGNPTPLKIWQVQMVIEKIGRFLDLEKRWSTAYENVVDIEHFGKDAEFRDITKNIIIYDQLGDQPAEISLASTIDMLTGCNWNFPQNISTILAAIGGELHAQHPLALHARNIKLNPVCNNMHGICQMLTAFAECRQTTPGADFDFHHILGPQTTVKRWLAASLEKTIKLQFDF